MALLFVAAGSGDRAGEPAGHAAATSGGPPMALAPAGEFVMGEDAGSDDERPAHRVRLESFWIDRNEVTQQDYQSLMGKNPSAVKGARKPVEQVSWRDAIRYCNLRSTKEGLKPCYDPKTLACDFAASGYRLPTEAEWEYACRAGSRTRYSFGMAASDLKDYGWFKENAGGTLHDVGERKPNAWGLYDMHGNVWEWCHDVYVETYYRDSPAANPRGPAAGDERVLRGGSWRNSAERCRSASRHSEPPAFADTCFDVDLYGFRCVRRDR